jgi:hypothetical protein
MARKRGKCSAYFELLFFRSIFTSKFGSHVPFALFRFRFVCVRFVRASLGAAPDSGFCAAACIFAARSARGAFVG